MIGRTLARIHVIRHRISKLETKAIFNRMGMLQINGILKKIEDLLDIIENTDYTEYVRTGKLCKECVSPIIIYPSVHMHKDLCADCSRKYK